MECDVTTVGGWFQLNVPATFMKVATDDGSGSHMKYQCPELTKLHQVVSLLIRCCDVSAKCKSFQVSKGSLAYLGLLSAHLSPPLYSFPGSTDFAQPLRRTVLPEVHHEYPAGGRRLPVQSNQV